MIDRDDSSYTLCHGYCAVQRNAQGCAEARNARETKVPLPWTANILEDAAHSSREKSPKVEATSIAKKKLHSFHVAAGFKNRRPRNDTVLEPDRGSYWRMTPGGSTALRGTTDIKLLRHENLTCLTYYTKYAITQWGHIKRIQLIRNITHSRKLQSCSPEILRDSVLKKSIISIPAH